MHAKQRNPSRIQAQEVAQKGPECDAKVCLTRPSNPLKTLGPGLNSCLTFVSRPCMRNGTQMKKKLTVQWTASEWQLLPRLAWTSGPREHGVDDACETAKPQQDSSPRGGPKRSRMRRQGVPNPTFEPVKNTRTWASAGMLHPTFKPYIYRHSYRTLGSASETAKHQGAPHPTFEPWRSTSTRASATHAKRQPDEEKPNRAVDGKWMAASASVGLNFRAPRTWSGRCMRNSETPAGFKPKRWPKKVPNATPRCA